MELSQEFSRRRAQIEQAMEKRGWSGSKGASEATLATRSQKEEHCLETLKEDWSKRADELNFDGKAFVDKQLQKAPENIFVRIKDAVLQQFYDKESRDEKLSRDAVELAIETVSQKTSVFEYRKLKEAALRHCLTGKEQVTIARIDEAINAQIKEQSLYQVTCPDTKKSLLTTPWALTQEAETLARIDGSKGCVEAIATKELVTKELNNFQEQGAFPLTNSQSRAVMHFFSSKDRFNAIQGYAGTGKTTLLKLSKSIAEEQGYRVRGLAVSSSATDELNSKAGIKSAVFPVVYNELLRAKKGELNRDVFIVDEASMLSSAQAHALIKLVEQKEARLIMVGDDAQLPTVKNGRLFGLSQEYGIGTVVLDDIIRQKNDRLREAVTHAHKGEIHEAVHKINAVVTEKTHEGRIARIANDWLNVSQEQRGNTLLFAPTHRDKEQITNLIRDRLKEEGSISPTPHEIDVLKAKPIEEVETRYTRYYETNDVIRFNKNTTRYRINSGDYLTVANITDKDIENNTLLLIRDNGKKVRFHLDDLPKYKKSQAGLSRHLEVYRKETKELCQGDKIQWTRNSARDEVINSTRATIKSITQDKIEVELANGRSKSFDAHNAVLKHIDYGYVFTNYKVQGKDKMYGIGLIESYNKFSATARNFYVQISRGVYDMKIVTDDTNNLIKTLVTNDDSKKSALDHVTTEQLKTHNARYESHNKSLDLARVIDKKSHKEAQWHEKQQCITRYKEAREAKNEEQQSALAHQIISDPVLTRMANHQLGHSYSVYRNESLKFATKKLKETLSPDNQQRLGVIERYVTLTQVAQDSWREVAENQLKNDTSLDKNKHEALKTKAFGFNMARNKLAHQISNDISGFKPYLKHFSIGELNRQGVPDFKIDSETARAERKLETLGAQAQSHASTLDVDAYFKSSAQADKQRLALMIQASSKQTHPYLIHLAASKKDDVGDYWKAINSDAKREKDANFRQSLSSTNQIVFDAISHYKALGISMGQLGEQYVAAKLQNDASILEGFSNQLQQLSIQRNSIASMVIKDRNSEPVLKYFKLDRMRLESQAQKDACRNNVMQFRTIQSNFKEKLALAQVISQDIKAHYPYMIEQGLNKQEFSQYQRVVNRRHVIDELSHAQKEDYKQVLAYRYSAKLAGKAWQSIFTKKNENIGVHQEELNKACALTAKRDARAFPLVGSSQYASFLQQEKVNIDKLAMHSATHQRKLLELKEITEVRQVLLAELEKNEDHFSPAQAREWHQKWGIISQHRAQIKWAEHSYSHAIKEFPLADTSLPKPHSKLVEKYQLSANSHLENSLNKMVKPSKPKIDLTLTVERLMATPKDTYTSIFGEPKQISGQEMRYRGGLIVTLKGEGAGLWYDFIQGVGGGPIDAIMQEKGVDFKQALEIASTLAGTEQQSISSGVTRERVVSKDMDTQRMAAIQSAKSIWKGAKSIQNTLAETYLKEHRGISDTDNLNVRFWPQGAKWLNTNDDGKLIEKTNKIPALVIPAYNKSGHVTGVQRVYLDEKTGNKNTFMSTVKLSKGVIKGSAGIIQKGDKDHPLFIAEGPETAASIALVSKSSTVIVSFGLNNIGNLSELIKNQSHSEVIIAGDKDFNKKVDIENLTFRACNELKSQDIKATVVFPKTIDNQQKTDWNDVLVKQGKEELSNQLTTYNNISLRYYEAPKVKLNELNIGRQTQDNMTGGIEVNQHKLPEQIKQKIKSVNHHKSSITHSESADKLIHRAQKQL